MRKLIYPLIIVSSLTLISCSTIIDYLPGIYTLDIEQGNIIDQEMIDQLRPNMSKRQVLYIMGSSMLIDVFHQKRWDYLYSEQSGGGSRSQKRLSLYFDGDQLIGVQGDFKPSSLPVIRESKETTVEVPKRDFEKTLWEKISGLFEDDDPVQPDPDSIEDTVKRSAEVQQAVTENVDKAKDIVDEELITTPLEEQPTTQDIVESIEPTT